MGIWAVLDDTGGALGPLLVGVLVQAASAFFAASAISAAAPIDFTADIKEVDGKPLAKRGRIPGLSENSRLKPLEL